jgi:glycosyltransferase involved in cell wall biosynthesis
MIKFSILICSIKERDFMLDNLLYDLKYQTCPEIEILTEIDNRELTIGAKRNKLLDRATGDYIAFIDDDDSVVEDYVEQILSAIESKPDVVGIKGNYMVNETYTGIFIHSIQYKEWDCKAGNVFLRCPNHLNPVKRDLALQVKFPEINMSEDQDYSMRLFPLLKTEAMIKRPIYNYMKRSE